MNFWKEHGLPQKICCFLCLRGLVGFMWGQNFLPSSTLSLVFSSSSFSSYSSHFQGFHFLKFFSFSFELSSCNFLFLFLLLFKKKNNGFFFKLQFFFKTQAFLQVMMRSCMTWIERLQCFFMRGLLLVLLETCSLQQKWKRGLGILWCLRCASHIIIHPNIIQKLE